MSDSIDNTPSHDEAIETMAATWLVQKEEGFSAEEAAAFARWCEADPRHAAAVAMLTETLGILEKMPQLRAYPEFAAGAAHPMAMPIRNEPHLSQADEPNEMLRPASRRIARMVPFPAMLKVAMAVAACLVVGFVAWRMWPASEAVTFAHTYATAEGGFSRVVLPDESVLELNAQTEVRVRYSDAARRLTLTRGEAHFTVAKNPARPFFVGAANVAVRAVGTAFNVRLDKASVEVLVTEGRVHVSKGADAATQSYKPSDSSNIALFVAGQRVVVSTDDAPLLAPQVTTMTVSAIHETLAWQSPRLVFVDTPLSEVVRQFNDHNRVQLEIGDPGLGARAVGGTFRADHVETFVKLLENSGDVAAERPGGDRIVLRKVAPLQ